MIAGGITPVISAADLADFKKITTDKLLSQVISKIKTLEVDCQISELELVVVLGGDGTILKAAEIVRDHSIPLMGINLGHVGFLAESEREEFTEAVRRVLDLDYEIKERLTLEVAVFVDGKEVFRTWALNEATVEKNARERMLEVVLEIEGHPLSSFGCDGVVISTPTGSTAYAFSAGGPVVWPSVEALLVVPLSAHALFARPLVVKPDAMVAVEVLQRSAGHGILWCDGRRSWELPPGARVEVTKSSQPVKLARLRTSTFTDRLVNKFSLPVAGWRGPDDKKK
jgi:NAD+ kinase